jgi:hypothetical protein
MLRSVLTAFGIQEEMLQVTPFGTGLINRTWKVDLPGRTFILQKLNQDVIRDPNLVAQNLRIISPTIYSLLHYLPWMEVKCILTAQGITGCFLS